MKGKIITYPQPKSIYIYNDHADLYVYVSNKNIGVDSPHQPLANPPQSP